MLVMTSPNIIDINSVYFTITMPSCCYPNISLVKASQRQSPHSLVKSLSRLHASQNTAFIVNVVYCIHCIVGVRVRVGLWCKLNDKYSQLGYVDDDLMSCFRSSCEVYFALCASKLAPCYTTGRSIPNPCN